MVNLTTNYMGLELKNPIIVGSCDLTNSVEKLKKLEKAGAAAVVLKSIFEDQIMSEARSMQGISSHTEEYDYINRYIRANNLSDYINLIKKAKKEVDIPIIASINCSTPSEWVNYIKKIQQSGADAIELNIFIIPGNVEIDGRQMEQTYYDILKKVNTVSRIPVSIKMSYYFSGLANFLAELNTLRLDGLVLFNRFYRPDIDIEKLEFTARSPYSRSDELSLPLRWIGILADKIETDFVASTGVHNGEDVIKCLLAGAKATEVVSVLYKKSLDEIKKMLSFISGWLEKNKYNSISDIIGKMSQSNLKDPSLYERAQFMKYFHER